MGLLDGLIGGAVGAGMVKVVEGLIAQHGGVQGIAAQLEQQGLGNTVKSWIGTGPNQPISADQVHQAFGPAALSELAAKMGINTQDLAAKLAHALPAAVDHLTPGGVLPENLPRT